MPQDDEHEPPKPNAGIAAIQSVAQIFTTLVETFGWPGAGLILGFWFVVWYATEDQKHRIIETYVLGAGIANRWPLIILSVTFAAVTLAQHRWYVKRLGKFTGEIEREGNEKSALQGKGVKQLQHAKTKTKPRGK